MSHCVPHLDAKADCFQFQNRKCSIFPLLMWCKAMDGVDVPHLLYYIRDVKGTAEELWEWQFYDERYKYCCLCTDPKPWYTHHVDLYTNAR